MNVRLTQPFHLAGLVLWVGLAAVVAQTNLSNTTSPQRDGQAVLPENLTATDVSTASNLRPDRPERPVLPPEVRARIEQFKNDARKYLAQQEELKKRLEGANDKERAMVRRQIEDLRRQWLERAREMRKEFRERQADLMDKMPDYREVISSARNAALQQAVDAGQDNKPRRVVED